MISSSYEIDVLEPQDVEASPENRDICLDFDSPAEKILLGSTILGMVTLGNADILGWWLLLPSCLLLALGGFGKLWLQDFYRLDLATKQLVWVRRWRGQESEKARLPLQEQAAVILQGKRVGGESEIYWEYSPTLIATKGSSTVVQKHDEWTRDFEGASEKARALAAALGLPLYVGVPDSRLLLEVRGHKLRVSKILNYKESRFKLLAVGFGFMLLMTLPMLLSFA